MKYEKYKKLLNKPNQINSCFVLAWKWIKLVTDQIMRSQSQSKNLFGWFCFLVIEINSSMDKIIWPEHYIHYFVLCIKRTIGLTSNAFILFFKQIKTTPSLFISTDLVAKRFCKWSLGFCCIVPISEPLNKIPKLLSDFSLV